MSLMSILAKGGWTMFAIALVFVVGVFYAIERYIYLRRSSSPTDEILKRAGAWISEGDTDEAIKEIQDYDTPVSRVIVKGLVSGKEQAMEARAQEELKELENGMGVLASMGAIAPMLGFFGTVLGMIKAFMQIEILGGGVNPSRLAGGIWEALVTTAAGLAVGIIFLVIYNSLSDRLNTIVKDMKRVTAEISTFMEK